MSLKYYVRTPIEQPKFSQDYKTYIMLGRFAHLYCPAFETWFVINPAPDDVESLRREITEISDISRKEFFSNADRRAYLEIIEDRLGLRVTHVARFFRKLPFMKKIKWLKRLAFLDELQNWKEWEKDAKMPCPGEWME